MKNILKSNHYYTSKHRFKFLNEDFINYRYNNIKKETGMVLQEVCTVQFGNGNIFEQTLVNLFCICDVFRR
jgi:hypothetical protein